MHPTRVYNTITSLPNGYIKKESSTERLRDEINYYCLLPPKLNLLFPRLVDYNNSISPYWMILEQIPHDDVFYILRGYHTDYDTDGISMFIDDFLNSIEYALSILTHDKYLGGSTDNIKYMYIEKTWTEYQNFVKTRPDLLSLFQDEYVTLNGNSYLNFESLWVNGVSETLPSSYNETAIHGDFCLANMLFKFDDDILRLIDPRGSFGESGIRGDIRYDYAKLYHSLDGKYEFLINNWYHLERKPGEYTLLFQNTYGIDIFKKKFEERFFPTISKREIKLIEGCIYIGMCARHNDDPTRQLAMYLTGIRILNEAISL